MLYRTCLILAAMSSAASADLIVDFDSATGGPGWNHTTGSSGFQFAGSGNWDDGIAGEDAHVGSQDKAVTVTVSAALNQGVTGLAGDHAGSYAASITAGGAFWFGAMKFNAGDATFDTAAQMLLEAQIKAPADVRYRLSVTHDGGGSYHFNGIGSGQWQAVGGPLSSATLEGTVDLTRTDLRVELNTLDEWSWGQGATVLIDDLTFAPVPEPATLALVAGAGLLVLRRR
jgi:hypothetical protein